MKKRIFITAISILLILLIFSMPALAAVYRYTSTSFRYIGDILHQKVVEFDGGSAAFQISGEGEVAGRHDVQTIRYDGSTAEDVYDAHINITAYIIGTTALNAAADNKLRILSEIELTKQEVVLLTGVEMDPGETGFIRHDVVSSINSEGGDYLWMQNHFGNTGGTTKRKLEVEGFITETMRVDGYAEVWDTTEIYDGENRSGFWNTMP